MEEGRCLHGAVQFCTADETSDLFGNLLFVFLNELLDVK